MAEMMPAECRSRAQSRWPFERVELSPAVLQDEVEDRHVNPHHLSDDCRRARPGPSRDIDGYRRSRWYCFANLADHGRIALFAAMISAGSPGTQLLQREDDTDTKTGSDQLQQTFA
jgi:hypothetical protein